MNDTRVVEGDALLVESVPPAYEREEIPADFDYEGEAHDLEDDIADREFWRRGEW